MLCASLASACAAGDASGNPSGDGQSADTSAASAILPDFDIPALPLAAALERYSRITRLSIMIPGDMAHDLTSSPLRGRYLPEAALRLLLEGTGLAAEAYDSGVAGKTYLLKKSAEPAAPGLPALYSQGGYPGLVQLRIWQALCADPYTAPGIYRLLFRFQIDAAGHLSGANLLASTGDAGRDAEVLAALKRVQVEPPPPALTQKSMLMSLLPDGTGAARQCAQERP